MEINELAHVRTYAVTQPCMLEHACTVMSGTSSLLLVLLAAGRSLAQTVAVSVVPWCNHSIRVRMFPGNASTSPGAHALHATSLLSALSYAAHPSRRCTSSTCASCCATVSRSYMKLRHALPPACASQGRQQQLWSGHQLHVQTESSASHPSVPTLK